MIPWKTAIIRVQTMVKQLCGHVNIVFVSYFRRRMLCKYIYYISKLWELKIIFSISPPFGLKFHHNIMCRLVFGPVTPALHQQARPVATHQTAIPLSIS
jgi:hypothetical protein